MIQIRLLFNFFVGAILLLSGFVVMHTPDINADEARVLWVVQDNAPVFDVSVRDALRGTRDNVSSMLSRWRESGEMPLYIVLLDAWTMLTGASVLVGRWLSLLTFSWSFAWRSCDVRTPSFVIIAAALLFSFSTRFIYMYAPLILLAAVSTWFALRLLHRRNPFRIVMYTISLILAVGSSLFTLVLIPLHGMLFFIPSRPVRSVFAVLTVSGFALIPLLGLSKPAWTDTVASINAERDLLLPAIVAYPVDHALAYYERFSETSVRQGINVDVGWRDFSEVQLREVIDRVDDQGTVWVIISEDEPVSETLTAILAETHEIAYTLTEHDMQFLRFERERR